MNWLIDYLRINLSFILVSTYWNIEFDLVVVTINFLFNSRWIIINFYLFSRNGVYGFSINQHFMIAKMFAKGTCFKYIIYNVLSLVLLKQSTTLFSYFTFCNVRLLNACLVFYNYVHVHTFMLQIWITRIPF